MYLVLRLVNFLRRLIKHETNRSSEKNRKLAYIPFKEYLTEEQFNNIVVNKGKTGQILELTIGLQLSNTTLDFEDGELKTNKCNKLGIPAETMFITQTASIIDELLSFKLFEESKLYKKSIECYMFASTKKERLRIGCFCHLY